MSTTTTRLGLYKTASDGSELVNVVTDLLNNLDAIDLNIGYRDCTSSTRPSTVWKGLPIRESDTGRLYVSNGSSPASASWVEIPSAGAAVLAAMTFSGAVSLNSTLTVTGATVLNSTLRAVGATSLNSTLAVTGATTLSSTLAVTGNTTLSGNLTVSGIGQTQAVTKSATQSVTSSTTLVNDTHLLLPVAANAEYHLEGFVVYDGAFSAGDFKCDWSLPASASMLWAGNGMSTGAGGGLTANTQASGTTVAFGTYGAGPPYTSLSVRGRIVTAGTAGNAQFKWAQNSSNATATRVLAGSWIRLIRVA
ncbi:hypothetical protein [Kitasatospora camelliae]|uniref:Uncharacterized protein n=1 Tax=Kitasatospora camelliae TaxID=3156397 RepID=A0AAU8K6F3_9ACTN